MNPSLTDPPAARCALITGSARRVGRYLAEQLIADGWQVVVHATHEADARRAATELGAVCGLGADLRDPGSCHALVHTALERLGGTLDLLICNASTFVRASPHTATPLDWDTAFLVTARSPLLLTQAAREPLSASGGMALFLSDRSAHEHWQAYCLHAAAKAALESLCISCARSFAPAMRVNAIAPRTIFPPDAWSEDELLAAQQRGELRHPGTVLDALRDLLADPSRTGEVLVLP